MSSPTPFENIHNFRDVGASINRACGASILKEGVFFRSARLDDATPADLLTLSETYRVRTVIDLRTKSEHMLKPRTAISGPEASPWTTLRVNLLNRTLQMHLMLQLRWYLLLYFMVLMLLRQRARAIRLLGVNVLAPMGLRGLSVAMVRFCGAEVLAVLEVLREGRETPVLMHCTQGKDRTGVMTVIVGLVCGVGAEALEKDYAASEEGVKGVFWKEVGGVGLGKGFMGVAEGVVQAVVRELEDCGGVEGYLDTIGFGEEKRRELRKVLMR